MRLDTRVLQEGLTVLGHDPGPVDGLYGDRTHAAMMSFLQEFDDGFYADRASVEPSSDGKRVDISAHNIVGSLQEAARQFTPSMASRPPRRSVTPVLDPDPTPTSVMTPSRPFWRKDNMWAWTVGLGATALLGGFFFYAYRKGWLS